MNAKLSTDEIAQGLVQLSFSVSEDRNSTISLCSSSNI